MLATWGTSTGRNPTLDLQFAGATSLDNRITFSRGSQATLFDLTGALVYAKHNLLLQSQTFETTWSALNVTVSTNTMAAPDGTTTADTLTPAASSAAHLISQSVAVTASALVTGSVYVKTDGAPFVQVAYDNGASVGGFINVNLANGAITRGPEAAGGAANVTGSVIDVGGGYYRILIAATHTGATGRLLINPLPAGQSNAGLNPTTTTAVTDKVIVWGAQLNQTPMEGGVTSSLSTYYPTVASAYYAPRFDYNPSTLAAQGLLIEEQRTNSIRNNTMQGAVAGTPGTLPTNWSTFTALTGLTRTVVSTGTENGITYVDIRVNGTPSAGGVYGIYFEASNQVAAVSGQNWSNSAYLKLAGGSLSGISSVNFVVAELNNIGGFLNSSTTAVIPTSAALSTQRVVVSRTFNQATTAFALPYVDLVLSGVAIDITLRIGLPQLEQGAFATSVIPTTTTALTRNADVASMTGTNFSSWYNQTEGSLFGQFSLLSSSYTGGVAIDIGAGGAFGATEYIAWNGTAWSLLPNAAPVNVSSSITTTSTAKVIAAIKANDSVISANGLLGPVDTSCAVPASATTLTIGKAGWSGGANYLNGYIQRISYYPVRLPNSTLQALTA